MNKILRKPNIWDLHIHTPLGTPTKKNYGGVSANEFSGFFSLFGKLVGKVIFVHDIPIPKFKHLFIDGIPGAREKLLSMESRVLRHQTFEKLDMARLKEQLENELLIICNNEK